MDVERVQGLARDAAEKCQHQPEGARKTCHVLLMSNVRQKERGRGRERVRERESESERERERQKERERDRERQRERERESERERERESEREREREKKKKDGESQSSRTLDCIQYSARRDTLQKLTYQCVSHQKIPLYNWVFVYAFKYATASQVVGGHETPPNSDVMLFLP